MKKEYDFSKGIKGKFYVPKDEIQLPVYLDKKILLYYENIANQKKMNLDELLNVILEKEIEIQKELKIK